MTALSEYLADRNNAEFPRISTANGLCEIGKRHPETRDHIIGVLANQLAKHEPEVYHLNAFLVGYLADLKASESAEVIERAFAAGLVDETVCGEWTTSAKNWASPDWGSFPTVRVLQDHILGLLGHLAVRSRSTDSIAIASGSRTNGQRQSGNSRSKPANATGNAGDTGKRTRATCNGS